MATTTEPTLNGLFVAGAFAMTLLYCWLVFVVARAIGHDVIAQRRTWLFFAFFLIGSTLASVAAIVVPIQIPYYVRIAIGLGMWLMHAPPSCLGLWIGLEDAARDDAIERARRTDQWLEQWEHEPPGPSILDDGE